MFRRSARGRVAGTFAAGALFLVIQSALAQITLDGTLGRSGSLVGPNYAIPASVGRQVGGNLFHSFGRFSVYNGESATFSGPGSVSNIIGRVTGGYASTIDGLLRSTISGANLFLINPKGVMFGPNASLDISGSFYASTADYLALGSTGRFDATNPSATVLVSAPPSAFGFLSAAAGALEVNGSTLSVNAGKNLSFIGGSVSITDATLQAPAGYINIASVAGAGEARISGNQVVLPSGVERGAIELTNSEASVDSAEGLPAGKIVIRGGTLRLLESYLSSSNSEAAPGGGIEIDVSGEFSMQGGQILSSTDGPGAAGNIDVKAHVIALSEAAQILSST